MKTRIKTLTTPSLSRDDIESIVNEIQLITLDKIKTTAALDQAIADLRGPYDLKIAAYDEALKTKSAAVQQWAEANPSEFAKRKSIQFPTGTVGFRTGTHKLKLLSRWTWTAVLDAMNKKLRFWSDWIRTKQEVDKDALIRTATTDAEAGFAEHQLKSIGLKLVQDESFYIDPDLTEVEPRQTNPTQQSAA